MGDPRAAAPTWMMGTESCVVGVPCRVWVAALRGQVPPPAGLTTSKTLGGGNGGNGRMRVGSCESLKSQGFLWFVSNI